MKSKFPLTYSIVFGILVIAAVIFVGCTSTTGEKTASTNGPVPYATTTVVTIVPVPTSTTPLTTTTSPPATGTIALATTTSPPTALTTAPPTVSTTVVATSSQPSATVSVSFNNHDFRPSPLTISRGTTVIWTNKDPSAISFASDASAPAAFRSGSLASGSTYQFTFTQPGLYRYRTETSPQSGGQITVT